MTEKKWKKFDVSDRYHFFFGYYDKTNFDANDTYILSHRTKFIDRFPGENDLVDIGYINLENGVFTKVGRTKAWNWQEGSMLQFYKNRLNEPALLIYNIIKNNRLVSVVVNLQGEVVNQFPVPIAAVNNGNGKIVSYDFHKLKWLRRGYHYAPDFESNDKIQDNLILYDPVKSEETQLISLSKCQREFFRPSMRGAEHFFQHCMFSPEGDKLAFLHRWRESNGNIHSHLIILSLITGKILNATQSSRCTHFTWVDNFNLVLFTSKQNSATQLRQFISNTWLETLALKLYRKIQQSSKHGKPMLQMDNYFRYDIRKSELCSFTASQHTDGHPHNLDNQVLITDTYPSPDETQKLLFLDKNDGTLIHEICFDVDITYANSPLRCDFHPRVSPSKKYLSIDIAQSGKRFQSVITL